MPPEIQPAANSFDLQPDPRILQMLGEIDLRQWQCISELVDNSADAFIEALREGQPIVPAQISVSLPHTEDPGGRVIVRDNGLGMSAESLGRAVRAGWSSHDPLGNLGLFGMGFNIATARLGNVTEVWTSRAGDAEEVGLRIDLIDLVRQHHYMTPTLRRPKSDPQTSGTEICISELRPEQREWFSRAHNRSNLRNRLGRVYSTMLRPNGVPVSFSLQIDNRDVSGHQHCTWDETRVSATRDHGDVPAIIHVDRNLGDRPFSIETWEWLSDTPENRAAAFDTAQAQIIMRPRHIRGWLGIQVFCDQTDFGIDFIRNGRKIEIQNKDLFSWESEEGILEDEYPIDDIRLGGRIVGEIHLDHCRVPYTKDRFQREDPAWRETVALLRGLGPLRPDKARGLGYGANDSPLYRLYQAYRRATPRRGSAAGSYVRLLSVPNNERSKEMAKRFRAGVPEYQTDEKWYRLAQEADEAALLGEGGGTAGGAGGGDSHGADGGDGGGGDEPIPGFGGDGSDGTATTTATATTTDADQWEPFASLTDTYVDDVTSTRWDVRAQRRRAGTDIADRPWQLKCAPEGHWTFSVETRHAAFASTTLTPLDALIAELASDVHSHALRTREPDPPMFGDLLTALRFKYASTLSLDPDELSSAAKAILNEAAESIRRIDDTARVIELFSDLGADQQEAIRVEMARRGVTDTTQAIDSGRFLGYAPVHVLLGFIDSHLDAFLDGHHWDDAYSSLDLGSATATAEARQRLELDYRQLLRDVGWAATATPGELSDAPRARLVRASAAIELLEQRRLTPE